MFAGGVALAALYAVLALGSGLDRMAALGEIAPDKVPSAIRVAAARVAAQDALARGDARGALVLARRAVGRDPIDANALGALGAAALASGDEGLARAAFRAADRLGRREPFDQAYWLQDALARGDHAGAARRIDAILRQNPDFPARAALLAPLDAIPEGRAALTDRLALRPAWAAQYFLDTDDPAAGLPLARADVAERLARGHGIHDCALIAPLLEGLVRNGDLARARALYRLHCAASGEGVVPADGGFVRADAAHPPTVLDWSFTDDGAIGVMFAPRRGTQRRDLVVSSSAPFVTPFASEPLDLAPGRYRIAWTARGADGQPAASLDVALSCGTAAPHWVEKMPIDRQHARFAATVQVPAGCPRQRLVLGVASQADAVAVSDVTLNPG